MSSYAIFFLLAHLVASASANTCTVTRNAAFFLSLSTNDLYSLATKGNRVGACYIAEVSSGSCDLYVKSAVSGSNGDLGWPKTTGNQGTGCVRAPDYPKKVSSCFYSSSSYVLSQSERNSFCTNSGKSNAVAQLQHAIRSNACSIPIAPASSTCNPGTLGCKCIETCQRPTSSQGWSISSVRLDRVRRCRNKFIFCNSKVTRSEYKVFDSSHSKRQQKKIYLSMVNQPSRAATKNVVISIAGQQRDVFHDGGSSRTTGQLKSFKKNFKKTTGDRQVSVSSFSLINSVLRTGFFQKHDTFVGLVFDARYNYEYSRHRKNRVRTAYYKFIRERLTPYANQIKTIYIAGHSRGGCLAMRLAAKLTAELPKTRIIIHNYDGVCTARNAIFSWTKSEFGVTESPTTRNPVQPDYYTLPTDIEEELPKHNCLSVRSFLSGSHVFDEKVLGIKINPKVIRAFGHYAHKDAQNSLTTSRGYNWYTQSYHTQDHNSIDQFHFTEATRHLRRAFTDLPCECGYVTPSRGRVVPTTPRTPPPRVVAPSPAAYIHDPFARAAI